MLNSLAAHLWPVRSSWRPPPAFYLPAYIQQPLFVETPMSDITDLFEGKDGTNPITAVETFAKKEWANLLAFNAKLPADLKPLADGALADTQTVLVDAVEWGGTALSAYISANGDKLASEVVNLLQGATAGTTITSAAGQTAVQGVTKLILGVVAHAITDFVNAASPAAPAPGQLSETQA